MSQGPMNWLPHYLCIPERLDYLSKTLLMQQEYPTLFLTCLLPLLRGWQQSIQVLGWKHILLVLLT